GVQGSGAFGRG
nr:Chain P, BNP peptide epitope [synthetic construct]